MLGDPVIFAALLDLAWGVAALDLAVNAGADGTAPEKDRQGAEFSQLGTADNKAAKASRLSLGASI
jgi:hypothetical protein